MTDSMQPDGSSRLGNGKLILFVDDEAPIRRMAGAALKRSGYSVLLTDNGTEALANYALQRENIGVVITDMVMPVMDGVALSRELTKMDPQVKIIASTGRPDESRDAALSALGVKAFLEKPYSIASLLDMIQSVMQEPTAASLA